MRSRILAFALVLGALGAGSCAVYDSGDLTGPPGGGTSGGGSSGRAGSSGAGLSQSGSGNGGAGSNGGFSGGNSGFGGSFGGSDGGDGGGGDVSGGGGTAGGTAGTSGGGTGGGGTNQRPNLIDDCEDGNQNIRPVAGRSGLWFTTSEKGTITPPPSAITMQTHPEEAGMAPDSNRAFHFTAASIGAFALAGIDLVNPNPAPKKIYDASAFKGITFYAKATSAAVSVSVQFPIADTEPGVDDCDDTPAATDNACFDHFKTIDDIRLTTAWTQYTVLFEDLAQQGFGNNGLDGFTPEKLVSIHFRVATNADLWIDHVEFVPNDV